MRIEGNSLEELLPWLQALQTGKQRAVIAKGKDCEHQASSVFQASLTTPVEQRN